MFYSLTIIIPSLVEETELLNILFYSAKYYQSFGSIFPDEDICSLIPKDESDVAILEEPEHLNWFRAKDPSPPALSQEEKSPKVICGSRSKYDPGNNVSSENGNDENEHNMALEKGMEKGNLGWASKFKFVVGVIHTNYTAYMKQYGIGTSLVGAPAISAMSALVVRAYCHRVIRLSGVIPSYAKWKEVTSNVHGVRGDFLAEIPNSASQGKESITVDSGNDKKTQNDETAPVYFIGKLLWAKGFDRMLKIQEMFRDASDDDKYFEIDVYGGGPDETAIKRAFYGRNQNEARDQQSNDKSETPPPRSESEESIFDDKKSIKKQLYDLVKDNGSRPIDPYENAKDYINMGFEIIYPDDISDYDSDDDASSYVILSSAQQYEEKDTDPISIISDVSGKSLGTGIATTNAVKNLTDSAIKSSVNMFTTKSSSGKDLTRNTSIIFDPPQSLSEWRKHPIPARFLGVKDHASLKAVTAQKIFLNPSITEVLCTTTAEALAMGKFAIIPNHPSNTFFLQFPNCLSYTNLEECVQKLKWALQNDPRPLSAEHAHIFSWEAATDRFIEASMITKREALERKESGKDKVDSRMAWLHAESGKKGHLIKTFFTKNERSSTELDRKVEISLIEK